MELQSTSRMCANPTRYLSSLASLRFFAAMLVVLFHLRLLIETYQSAIQHEYMILFYRGYAGVSIFFVLSGVVISHANDNWKGWKVYLIGRVTRIYPSHWIVLFTIAIGSLIELFYKSGLSLDSCLKLFTNLTLTQSLIPNPRYYFSLNAVSWSLSVEMFFYISFLFIRRLKDRYIYILSILSYLILVAAAVEMRHEWSINIYWAFNVNPLARLPEFLAGMAIYRLYKIGALPKLWLPKFNFAVILISMIIVLSITDSISFREFGFIGSFTYSIIPMPFAALMIIALLDETSNKYMGNKILVLLGESSFALYLIHKPIVNYVAEFIRSHSGISGTTASALLIALAITFIFLSVIFYKLIEIPVTKSLKKMLIKKLD